MTDTMSAAGISAVIGRLQRGLATVLADRTALVIAHRLSTVEVADRVLVLDHGQIVEDGPPTNLSTAATADTPRCTGPGSTRWLSDAAGAEAVRRQQQFRWGRSTRS